MRSVLCVKPAFDWMKALLFVKKKRLLARCKRFEFALPVPQVISAVATFCVRILDLGRNHFCNFSRSLRKGRICGGTDALRKNWFPSFFPAFSLSWALEKLFWSRSPHSRVANGSLAKSFQWPKHADYERLCGRLFPLPSEIAATASGVCFCVTLKSKKRLRKHDGLGKSDQNN